MVVQGVFVGALLVTAFRLRRTFGLALVYIVFGVILQYANLLAGSVYVQLSPWLVVSPGSVVLFPAILFLVLFVYLSDDAVEARKLIFGVAIANIVFLPLGLLIGEQLQSPSVINPYHLSPGISSRRNRASCFRAPSCCSPTRSSCVCFTNSSAATRVRFSCACIFR